MKKFKQLRKKKTVEGTLFLPTRSCLPFHFGASFKGKKLLPRGANSFSLEKLSVM